MLRMCSVIEYCLPSSNLQMSKHSSTLGYSLVALYTCLADQFIMMGKVRAGMTSVDARDKSKKVKPLPQDMLCTSTNNLYTSCNQEKCMHRLRHASAYLSYAYACAQEHKIAAPFDSPNALMAFNRLLPLFYAFL